MKILEHLRRGKSRLQKFAWEFDVTSTLVYENLEKHCSHSNAGPKSRYLPLYRAQKMPLENYFWWVWKCSRGSRKTAGTRNSNSQILSRRELDKGCMGSRCSPIRKHDDRVDARLDGRWESQPYWHTRGDAYHCSVSRCYDHIVLTGKSSEYHNHSSRWVETERRAAHLVDPVSKDIVERRDKSLAQKDIYSEKLRHKLWSLKGWFHNSQYQEFYPASKKRT